MYYVLFDKHESQLKNGIVAKYSLYLLILAQQDIICVIRALNLGQNSGVRSFERVHIDV